MAATATDIVGTVGLDVIPVTTAFHTILEAAVLKGADKLGEQLGAAIGRTMAPPIAAAIPKAVSDGAKAAKADAVKQGGSTGGAFADSLRAKLEAAFKAMPKLDVRISDTGVDAELARLRAKLEDLRNKRTGVDLDVATAEAKIQEIDDRLARLGASSPNVRVRVDVATARAALADVQAEIRAASADPLTIPVRVSSFEADLIARVEAAQASLPVIEIRADTDPARVELDRYRAALAAIPTQMRVDADFNVKEALAKLATLRAGLESLKLDNNATIDVRVDAARAEAELAAISAEAEAMGRKPIHLNLDTASARGQVIALAVALASLAAPAIPAIVAGAGGIASAFVAAASGVGAFALAAAPALKNVSAAIQAQTSAANNSAKATQDQANAGATAAEQALQMAGAQQSLASAERSAASSIRNADEQIASAKRAVADATQEAADQQEQALRQVQEAEKSLTQAQATEKDAQESLTQARATAAQQLSDLKDQLADGALDERQAALDVVKARNDLANAVANQQSDPLGYAEAQLAYQQAVQAQKEQKTSYDRLKSSAAQQQAAGVNGNDAVRQAAEQLADAQADVADKTQAVADAQTNVVKTAKASAQAIADAQRQEADAYLSAADARADAADSIKSAERSIQEARLSASKSTSAATTQEDAYQAALAKLTPESRKLFDAIAGPNGLKPAFDAWSKSLQPEVIPLFIRGVDSAKNALPSLTPLVLAASSAISDLWDDASRQLKSPFWVDFKQTIDKTAGPAIVGLGKSIGNVFTGGAGIVDAFLQHIDGVDDTMERITRRFANWGTGLKGSPGFTSFLQYVKTEGPKAAKYIGQILSAIMSLATDIQPVTEGILSPLLAGLQWVAVHMPHVVQVFWALYLTTKLQAPLLAALGLGMSIYTAATADATAQTSVFSAVLASTGISEIVLAIEAAVALLAIGLYELWQHAGWFRDGLKAAWKGIEVAALWLWHDVIEPAFHGIVIAMQAIGTAAVWLWDKVLKPTWTVLETAARYLFTVIAVLVFTPMYILFTQVIAPVALWLWSHAFKPAFNGIADAATWLWTKVLHPTFSAIGDFFKLIYRNVIKPDFDDMVKLFHAVGDAATWLWNKAIKPAFQWLGDRATWLWDKAFKPAFDHIKGGADTLGDSFKTAVDAIKKQWSKVSDIAKKPVAFVVDHVYNEGIRPVWNSVAKITGVKTLGRVDTSKWATGGVLPGYTPGSDPHKFISPTGGHLELSGGEAILRPEVTRVLGAPFVYAINAIAQRGGVGGVRRAIGGAYANGGIFGDIGDAASSLGSGALGLGKDVGDFLAHPSKLFDDLTKKVKALVGNLGSTGWANMLKKVPAALVTDLKKTALSSLSSIGENALNGGNSPLGGVTRWTSVVQKALAFLGQPQSLLGLTLSRMNQESGGNPTIVNRWDANWKAGHPSVGLMQVIRGTFQKYAGDQRNVGPFEYGVSVDPFANVYASMRYALARYGSLQAAYGRAGGYDEGGWLQPGDWSVFNHTGRPEPVFTADQWATLRANLEAKNSTPNVIVESHTYLGNLELTDIVDHRIDVHTDGWATSLNRGRIL
jgi:SLT domain-containing protein